MCSGTDSQWRSWSRCVMWSWFWRHVAAFRTDLYSTVSCKWVCAVLWLNSVPMPSHCLVTCTGESGSSLSWKNLESLGILIVASAGSEKLGKVYDSLKRLGLGHCCLTHSYLMSDDNQTSLCSLLFHHWKTYVNMSTIATSLILSKKLVFIIICSICYLYFIVAK